MRIAEAENRQCGERAAERLIKALACAKLTGVQRSICLLIFKRTLESGRREACITLKEFAAFAGSGSTYISKQLKKLLVRHVVVRRGEIGKACVYRLNEDVEEWVGREDAAGAKSERLPSAAPAGTKEQGLASDTAVGAKEPGLASDTAVCENVPGLPPNAAVGAKEQGLPSATAVGEKEQGLSRGAAVGAKTQGVSSAAGVGKKERRPPSAASGRLPPNAAGKKRQGLSSAARRISVSANDDKQVINKNKYINHHHQPINDDDDDTDITPIARTYRQEFGRQLSPAERQKLAYYQNQGLSEEIICEALKRARQQGQLKLCYAVGILNNWLAKGITDISGVMQADIEFKKRAQLRAPAYREANRYEGADRQADKYDSIIPVYCDES